MQKKTRLKNWCMHQGTTNAPAKRCIVSRGASINHPIHKKRLQKSGQLSIKLCPQVSHHRNPPQVFDKISPQKKTKSSTHRVFTSIIFSWVFFGAKPLLRKKSLAECFLLHPSWWSQDLPVSDHLFAEHELMPVAKVS